MANAGIRTFDLHPRECRGVTAGMKDGVGTWENVVRDGGGNGGLGTALGVDQFGAVRREGSGLLSLGVTLVYETCTCQANQNIVACN